MTGSLFTSATTELITADPNVPILTIGDGNGALKKGPLIENVEFRDISGACVAVGGIHLIQVARARLDNLSFRDFCNGYAHQFR